MGSIYCCRLNTVKQNTTFLDSLMRRSHPIAMFAELVVLQMVKNMSAHVGCRLLWSNIDVYFQVVYFSACVCVCMCTCVYVHFV